MQNFFSSLILDEKNFVSFGDSNLDENMYLWLQYFLMQEYGVEIFPAEKCKNEIRQTSAVIRDFVYYIPNVQQENGPKNKITHYKELEWYINRKDKYGFATKGGKNDEERGHHNHNDIGSFIVVNNGKQVLCDLGCGEYTREYFSEKRYMFLNTNSLGHSVPIINGVAQGTGEVFYGKLVVNDDSITIDMENAYPVEIKKLNRKFELNENSILLTDTFDKGLNITERFVTRIEPIVENNKIILDKTNLVFPKNWTVDCKCEYTTIGAEDSTQKKVYLIDFIPKFETDNFRMTINFID